MRDEINPLIFLPPPENRLPVVETPSAIRSRIGLERKTAGTAGASSSAVATPIISEEVTVRSTDGLFSFVVRAVI